MSENRNRVAAGDTHSLKITIDIISKSNLEATDIYFVGDGGECSLMIQKHYLVELDRMLKERDCNLYCCRGNHSNPEFWANGGYRTNNLWFVPDYTVVNGCLFLGGAISIDRFVRIATKAYWWPEEIFTYNPIVETLTGVTDIIAHSRPDFCLPGVTNKLVEDYIQLEESKSLYTLRSMLVSERWLIGRAYHKLSANNNIKTFCSGHFHSSGVEYIKDTKFNYLGINELKQF